MCRPGGDVRSRVNGARRVTFDETLGVACWHFRKGSPLSRSAECGQSQLEPRFFARLRSCRSPVTLAYRLLCGVQNTCRGWHWGMDADMSIFARTAVTRVVPSEQAAK
jgi:hypothetical protein